MNIYKIDSIHRNIVLDKGGSKRLNKPPLHEFDLPNNHTYKENEEFISPQKSEKSDLDFAKKLSRITPPERVDDFLDYQFEHAENKVAFLKHLLKGGIVNLPDIARTPTRQTNLIEWINSKQRELEQNMKPETQAHEKLKWNGDQKQLAELFITLEQLRWIEPIQDGKRQSICRNICNLFDISHTKKKPESDEIKSFAEIMKPDTDKKTKNKPYSKVFSARYKKKFSLIEKP